MRTLATLVIVLELVVMIPFVGLVLLAGAASLGEPVSLVAVFVMALLTVLPIIALWGYTARALWMGALWHKGQGKRAMTIETVAILTVLFVNAGGTLLLWSSGASKGGLLFGLPMAFAAIGCGLEIVKALRRTPLRLRSQ